MGCRRYSSHPVCVTHGGAALTNPATNPSLTPPFSPATTDDAVVRVMSPSGRGVRFHIVGHLSDHNARLLRQRIDDELLEGQRTIVIDVAHANTFDPGALGVLVSITRRVREEHGVCEFDNLSEQVRLLFELMRLDHVFTIRDPQRAGRRTPSPGSIIPIRRR